MIDPRLELATRNVNECALGVFYFNDDEIAKVAQVDLTRHGITEDVSWSRFHQAANYLGHVMKNGGSDSGI